MKIILRQDVENLGNIGEIVVVKPGYARNYLIPNQLAYVATDGAIRALETEKKQYEVRKAKARQQAEVIAAQLAELQITVSMQVGEEGRIFGSVTAPMVAQ
jgi:large subunit ribosomal protein L9